MTLGGRFELRPSQRSRNGVPALGLNNPPTVPDVMIDKLVVSVSGSFGPRTTEDNAGKLFEHYRAILEARVQRGAGDWQAPRGKAAASFWVQMRPAAATTIGEAKLKVEWAKETVNLRLKMSLNPTRTLLHRLRYLIMAGAEAVPSLTDMPPHMFFGRSSTVEVPPTLDGNDNMLMDLNAVRSALGADYASTFLAAFDYQLRKWALDAIAPEALGFIPAISGEQTQSALGVFRARLNWNHLTVNYAEGYFERSHGSAVRLLDRLSRSVPASHTGAGWRRYGENEIGQRRPGSELVGLDLSNTVQQVYYAKTPTRVRAETRFTRAVRNAVRVDRGEQSERPLFDLLQAIRRDVLSRCRWRVFCSMCEEPARPVLAESAQLLLAIVTAAHEAGVNPEPVLTQLLGTGGLDGTSDDGSAPSRLIRHLCRAGVLDKSTLHRRRRPGEVPRYRLAPDWMELAERLQRAFVEQSSA